MRNAGGSRAGLWARRITDIYVFVMLAVFPLFTGFNGYKTITLSKFVFFTASTLAWLLCLAVCGLVFALSRRPLRISPRLLAKGVRPCEWAIGCFMLFSGLSALISPYRDSVFIGAGRYEGLASILMYGAVFLLLSRLAQPRRAHAAAFGLSVCVCCAVAAAQLWGYDPFGLFPGDLNYYDAHTLYTGEFLGTIGNANLLSGFLSLSTPFFTVLFLTGERRSEAVFLTPAALGVFVLVASKVSGGIVALSVCAALCAAVLIRNRRRFCRAFAAAGALALSAGGALLLSPQYSNGVVAMRALVSPAALSAAILGAGFLCVSLIAALTGRERGFLSPARCSLFFSLIIGAVLAVGLLLVYFLPPGTGGTLYEFSRVLHGDIQDGFGSSRIRIWREVLALFPERPLFGGGPDTLALRLNIEFSRFVPETGKTLRSFVDNAHNEYLGYLANVGLFGLVPYLAAMLSSFLSWLRARDCGSWAAALGAALICYWTQGFFGLGLCIIAPFLWIFWGLFEASANGAPPAREGIGQSVIKIESNEAGG